MTPIVALNTSYISNSYSERLITNFSVSFTVTIIINNVIINIRNIQKISSIDLQLSCFIVLTYSSRGALNFLCHSNLVSSFSSLSSFDFSFTRPGGGSYMKFNVILSLFPSLHNRALKKHN